MRMMGNRNIKLVASAVYPSEVLTMLHRQYDVLGFCDTCGKMAWVVCHVCGQALCMDHSVPTIHECSVRENGEDVILPYTIYHCVEEE